MVSRVVRFSVFSIFILGFLYGAPCQGQDKDAGLWTSVSFEAKVVKKLTANISQEFRFNENITEMGTVFTEFGLDYKINKHFQIAANYRYSHKLKTADYYSIRHRFYFDMKYSKKLKPFQIKIRSRLQDEYADFGRASDGGIPEFYLRNKFDFSMDTKNPFSPYLSAELFSPLNYPQISAFDNIRFKGGVEYSVSKHHKLDLFYMVQRELNVSRRPVTEFIVGLGYSYKL